MLSGFKTLVVFLVDLVVDNIRCSTNTATLHGFSPEREVLPVDF